VAELLRARLPITFQLGLMALIVALLIAIPIGIYSAIRQDNCRRLRHTLVLDPDACRAELLDGHDGHGLSVDLVGLVAGK